MNFSDLITNLKDYMHYMNSQRFCVWLLGCLISLCVLIMFSVKKKKMFAVNDLAKLGVLVDINLIIVITLVGRDLLPTGIWKWAPFWSYITVFSTGDMKLFAQIILNILLFVPLGVLLPCCTSAFKRWHYVFVVAGALSWTIEIIQGITLLGWFELDDILNNLLGTVIGLGMYKVCTSVWGIRKKY